MSSEIISVKNLPVNPEENGIYYIEQPNPNTHTHGFFKYPCKFIPEIPRWSIKKYANKKNMNIFDPFAGSGTTLLEGIILGNDTYGTEIDLVAKKIINAKTNIFSMKDIQEIKDIYKTIIYNVENEDTVIYVPKINNLNHWFNNENLEILGKLKTSIDKITNESIKLFFEICFISIIKKVSNADDSSPKPYVSRKIIKTPPDALSEFKKIYSRYLTMEHEMVVENIDNSSTIIEGDALDFKTDIKFDLAVTSPPYINAFDYPRTMRLENLWLETIDEDMIRKSKKEYVGTEQINVKEEINNLDILNKSLILKEIYYQIAEIDLKRALIVKKFFEDMEKNLISVNRSLKKNGYYVIVIGNSTIRKITVPSWEIIREIALKNGYSYETNFSYVIRNPYIRFPRNNKGGKINSDSVLVIKKGN